MMTNSNVLRTQLAVLLIIDVKIHYKNIRKKKIFT